MTDSSSQPVAWVTGAGGLMGNYLVQMAPHLTTRWRAFGLTRNHLDLLDTAAARSLFQKTKPGLVIHCAAMSKSPECQGNPKLARKINVETTELLAELAADLPLVFFSSDLVFDGRTGGYHEASPVNPLSVYGGNKVEAERIVLANPRHLVIRTSLNAGMSPTGDRAFNEQLRRAWERGECVRLFADEFRCPIAAAVTARATWELVNNGCTGLYHIAGSERLSRYEIGAMFAARWTKLAATFEAASCRDFRAPPRSPDTSLDCTKAQSVLSFRLPAFSQWLREQSAETM